MRGHLALAVDVLAQFLSSKARLVFDRHAANAVTRDRSPALPGCLVCPAAWLHLMRDTSAPLDVRHPRFLLCAVQPPDVTAGA